MLALFTAKGRRRPQGFPWRVTWETKGCRTTDGKPTPLSEPGLLPFLCVSTSVKRVALTVQQLCVCKESLLGPGKLVQWVKGLAAKFADLSSIPRTPFPTHTKINTRKRVKRKSFSAASGIQKVSAAALQIIPAT